MLASKLIEQLKELIEDHDDLEVFIDYMDGRDPVKIEAANFAFNDDESEAFFTIDRKLKL